MKKKNLLLSAVALVTANALAFGPVSYKIIGDSGTAYAASETASVTVQAAAANLNAIYAQIKGDAKLKAAFNAAWTLAQDKNDSTNYDIANNLPNLSAGLQANSVAPSDFEAALKGLVTALLANFSLDKAPITDVHADVEDAIANLNTVLGSDITKDDVAELMKSVEDQLLTELDGLDFISIDVTVLFDTISAALTNEWDNPSNVFVSQLQEYYNSKEDLEADIRTAKASFEGSLSSSDKAKLTAGAGALAIGYFKTTTALENANVAGKNVFDVNFLGVSGVPLSAFDWKATSGTATIKDGTIVVVSSSKTPTVTATLKAGNHIPEALVGAVVISQQVNVIATGGGFDSTLPAGPLAIGTNPQDFANSVDSKIKSYLESNGALSTNAGIFGLKALIENELRTALTVASKSKLTVDSGVSTLALTVSDLDSVLDVQTATIIAKAKEAFAASNEKLELNVVLTFDLSNAVSNSKVDLSKAVVDALKAKGITTVGIKVGGAIIEVPLAELEGAASILVKKSTDEVTGLQAGTKQVSNIFSVQVLNESGTEISTFPGQYRLSIAPTGAQVNSSKYSIAKVGTGSITLVGGNYNANDKQVHTYRSGFSDYVLLENNVSFKDIANLKWASDSIELAASKGIILGRSEGVFDPKANVTRAEFTAMLVRALGIESDVHTEGFTDVSDSAWYHSAVASATAYGIINGRTATTFDPSAKITRDEMATITANALKAVIGYEAVTDVDASLVTFTDAFKVATVHRAGVALVAQEGIVQGKGKGLYDPKGNATRAEAAVIIAKVLNLR